MTWTVLSDNRTQNPSLQTEHGLSILLETEKHRILLDTGASDVFIRNAEVMGINLSTVDNLFISHGHSDNAGGLKHFMAINDKAKIRVRRVGASMNWRCTWNAERRKRSHADSSACI
jgi:7,8-dihydropterin-6-yl-methyl-4-(beta-D-ribofuranosyl)aminobenzene 5'-phosphate synthase